MNKENFNDEKLRGILNTHISTKLSGLGKELIDFRSSFQQSAQTIIDNLSQILNSVEEEVFRGLTSELSALETTLRGRLEPEIRSLVQGEIREQIEAGLEEKLNAARQDFAETERKRAQSRIESLNRAMRDISLQRSQVDILTCYLNQASLFAPRVALFVIKVGNIVGWQARGFEGEFNNESIKSLMFSGEQDTFLRRVYESKIALKESTASNPDILEVASKFGPIAPDNVCSIPLVVRDKTVAILYADSGLIPDRPIEISSLEALTTVVCLTVELGSARTKLGIKPLGPAAPETHPKSPTPAPASAASSTQESVSSSQAFARHATEEVKEKSQVAEALLGFESVQAVPVPQTSPAPPFPASTSISPETRTAVSSTSYSAASVQQTDESEQKLHNEARRFARLLVSEIKLYNEQKVQDGRRDKNLYDLLRDDIDKSREMYEKRVAANVAVRKDYFFEELVKILADNHSEALGSNCPGPVLTR